MPKPRAIPLDEGLWEQAKTEARRRYRVWPSPPASAFAAGWYKDQGGRWSGQAPVRQQNALARGLRRNQSRLQLGTRVSFRGGTGGQVSSATAFRQSSPKMPLFKFAKSRRPPIETDPAHTKTQLNLATAAGVGLLSYEGLARVNGAFVRAETPAREWAVNNLGDTKRTNFHVRSMGPLGVSFSRQKGRTNYNPKRNHVSISTDEGTPSSFAHEYGHAEQFAGRAGKPLMAAHRVHPLLANAPLVGAVQYARLREKDPKAADRWAKGTAAVGAAGLAFRLGLEGDATRRALRTLRDGQKAGTGLTDAGYRAARASLGYSFGTYASADAAPLVALGLTVGGIRLREHIQKKRLSKNTIKKEAGGPGSGVRFHNTELITGYDRSPVVSVGTRREIMAASKPARKSVWIKTSQIRFVGQKSYVVAKLGRMLRRHKTGETPDWARIPVDLYFDGTAYHVMDGHHRFLAAVRLGFGRIKANVWTSLPERAKEAQVEPMTPFGAAVRRVLDLFGPDADARYTNGMEGLYRVETEAGPKLWVDVSDACEFTDAKIREAVAYSPLEVADESGPPRGGTPLHIALDKQAFVDRAMFSGAVLAAGAAGYQVVQASRANTRRKGAVAAHAEAVKADARLGAARFEGVARRHGFAGSFHHKKSPNPGLTAGDAGSYNAIFDDKKLLQESAVAIMGRKENRVRELLSPIKANGNRKAQMYVPSAKGLVSHSTAFHELGHHRSFQQSGDAYEHYKKLRSGGKSGIFAKATDHPQYHEESRAWENAKAIAKQEKAGPVSEQAAEHGLGSYRHGLQQGKHIQRGALAAVATYGLLAGGFAVRMAKHGSRASRLETVSALEHRQWATWARSLQRTLKQDGERALAKRVRRWTPLFVPYSQLSDADKEKDRTWARKALAARKPL